MMISRNRSGSALLVVIAIVAVAGVILTAGWSFLSKRLLENATGSNWITGPDWTTKPSRVRFDKDRIELKGGDKGLTAGENVPLPEGFPADIPIYPGGNIVTTGEGGNLEKTTVVTYVVNGKSTSDIETFYTSEMNKLGWTPAGSASVPGARTIHFTKNSVQLRIILQETEGKTNVYLQIKK